MPIRPYAINDTYTANAYGNRTFAAKKALLGELVTGEMDYSQLINAIPSTLLQLYQLGNQSAVRQQLLELNIERSKQGKAPITLDQIGGAALASPNVGTTVSLSPDTKQMLVYGAVGLGAMYLLSKRKARRR